MRLVEIARRAAFILPAAIALSGAGKPGAVSLKKESKTWNYEISWSAEAAAVPALDALLRKKADESTRGLIADADEAYKQAQASKDGWFPEVGYELNWGFETAGESARLLSLAGDWYTFTGGAHGIFGTDTILWERAAAKPIALEDIFAKVTEFALLQPAMCTALDKQRAEKRESDAKLDTGFAGLDDAFNGCPKYEELTIWLSDADKDGRFDRINFAADPYVAGPYVEGSYLVELPLSKRLVDAIRPEYRDGFEVQGTQ